MSLLPLSDAQAHVLGVAAQQPGAGRVDRADPQVARPPRHDRNGEPRESDDDPAARIPFWR